MNISDFLERFVEGYLFRDLHSMASITLPKGEKYGAVGYPMVSTTLAGIELLGTLTSEVGFTTGGGEGRFIRFWENYLYVSEPDRRPLAEPIYVLVRHGLAHMYMTKPTIVVTKHRDPRHLHRVEGYNLL